MQPPENEQNPYAPPEKSIASLRAQHRFPVGRFWFWSVIVPGILPVICAFTRGNNLLALLSLLPSIPFSLAGAVIFSDYRKKVSQPALPLAFLVFFALLAVNVVISIAGCSIGNTFLLYASPFRPV